MPGHGRLSRTLIRQTGVVSNFRWTVWLERERKPSVWRGSFARENAPVLIAENAIRQVEIRAVRIAEASPRNSGSTCRPCPRSWPVIRFMNPGDTLLRGALPVVN